MKIIGFNILKISTEKKENFQEKLQVNQNIDITDLTKEKSVISDNELIKIYFKFLIEYSNDFAKLTIEGFVIILPEKDDIKKFLKTWKDKKIPEEFRIPIFNFIMNKCNVKSLFLEDELNLPYHIPLPRLSEK